MQRFTELEAVAMPMAQPNIDTDQIIPARFLQKLRKDGFGQYLFHDLAENPDFILNQPLSRRQDSRGGAEFWLRIVTRKRRLGALRSWISRRDRTQFR